MATQLKELGTTDKKSTRTLLHEAIPITGSIVSGTYVDAAHASLQQNIRDYSHGMFQSVYDYPYLSSSANQLFDLTFGYSANSPMSASNSLSLADGPGSSVGLPADSLAVSDYDDERTIPVQQEKKINVYNQMAQMLMGHDETGAIKEFQLPDGTKIREAFFITFSRLLVKDEIKKGSFVMKLGKGSVSSSFRSEHQVGATHDADGEQFYDLEEIRRQPPASGQTDLFYTDSPVGEYAVLSGSTSKNSAGLIFYQAGVVVLTASLLMHPSGSGHPDRAGFYAREGTKAVGNASILNHLSASGMTLTSKDAVGYATRPFANTTVRSVLTGSVIKHCVNQFRHRLYSIDFNNTIELHSTKYYCRAHHNEFNYSANPTYLDGSKIRVKTSTFDSPVSYITTVGLYSADGELLAVSKLSEPLKKTPDNDLSITVRLDF